MKTIKQILMGAIVGAVMVVTSQAATLIYYETDFSNIPLGEQPMAPNANGWVKQQAGIDSIANSGSCTWIATDLGDSNIVLRNTFRTQFGSAVESLARNVSSAVGNDFTVSTSFTLNYASGQYALGLAGLVGQDGNIPNNAYEANAGYFASVSNAGVITIGYYSKGFSNGGNRTTLDTLVTGVALTANTDYTLSLTGRYNEDKTSLELTFAFFNNMDTYSFAITTSQLYAGNNFAILNYNNAVNSNLQLDYHYFGVTEAIPEPSTIALLGVGAGLLFFLRRRK
ncbi:MAG: PEP-CTERM sorting domain-containing protein [Verrucomicrobiales bacterium]|jgi:hypothetical protein|nr:PEP-CTERM sorting domain-containing protein [Verrucomicrobiales bacterium]